MFQPNDVIIVSRHDGKGEPRCGLFISIQGDIVHFRTLDQYSRQPPDAPLTPEDLSVYVISLIVFQVSSIPGKSGLRDFAETALFQHGYVSPSLVGLLQDNSIQILDIATCFTFPRDVTDRAFDLLDPAHAEYAFTHSSRHQQCVRATQLIRSPAKLKRLILQQDWGSVSVDDEKSVSKRKLLIDRLWEIDELDGKRWVRYQLLRRSRSISSRLKFELLDFCSDESTLKRICRNESEEWNVRGEALRRINKGDLEWVMEFRESTPSAAKLYESCFED